jgi:hypothetical protein
MKVSFRRPMLKRLTVKVQRPLASNMEWGPLDGYLVYDAARKYISTQSVPQEVRDAMGDDLKSFHQASWNGECWEIYQRVPDRAW